MTSRRLVARLLAATVSCALLVTASSWRAFAGESCEKPPEPLVLPADDTEKPKILAAIQAAEAEKKNEAIALALAPMIERRHDDFVPFIKRGLESSDQDVLATAIRAAATHEMKDLEKRVRKYMTGKQKWRDGKVPGHVVAASIDYLARLGFGGEEEVILTEHLPAFFKDEQKMRRSWGVLMVSASQHYFGRFKYKRAVPFIVEEMLPFPEPDPVSARQNPGAVPPEAYWKARVTVWNAGGEGWARWALKEITGLEFRTAREWRSWVKANKKELEK